jgi:nitroreductase
VIRNLILGCRTYRRFYQNEPIAEATLRGLVDLARLSGSGWNKQPLKFMLSCDPHTNAHIFPYLTWAAHLKGWPGPAEGERPAAYIVVLGDRDIGGNIKEDCAIAAHSILLGATEQGLGGCMIGALNRRALRRELSLPDRYELPMVVALGRPREQVVIDPLPADGDTRYWRDKNDVHHVPKRSLDEIIVNIPPD